MCNMHLFCYVFVICCDLIADTDLYMYMYMFVCACLLYVRDNSPWLHVVPWGFRALLSWTYNRYNMPIMITGKVHILYLQLLYVLAPL
jgi:hypothetical protein